MAAASAALLAACGPADRAEDGGPPAPEEEAVRVGEAARGATAGAGDVPGSPAGGPGVVATEEDWRIVRRKVEWGRSQGLDTLPVGRAVARLGTTFVGTPYVPRTLEVEGPERLVVNLRALDCVTFVETVLALVHVIRDPSRPGEGDGRGAGDGTAGRDRGPDGLSGPERELREAYRRALTRLRYRGGVLDGYPSRLHYFSEWIRDGEEKGIVRDVTAELGGVPDPEPLDFMTEHPDAYRQLADPEVRAEIRRTEERLSRAPRLYVPQDRIEDRASGVRDGDVIAATSALPGLDVAHTGLALWRDGRLHLLHAPLVGDSVEISERTLARRISGIESQDGIIVARPLELGGPLSGLAPDGAHTHGRRPATSRP